MPTVFFEGGWTGRAQGNFMSIGWKAILEGRWTTSWPTAWICGRKRVMLTHYYFSWNNLTFYTKKEEDKCRPMVIASDNIHSILPHSNLLLRSSCSSPWRLSIETHTWCYIYWISTYIYFFLIKKYLRECRSISVKLLCVYLCLSPKISIFSAIVSSFWKYYIVLIVNAKKYLIYFIVCILYFFRPRSNKRI